MWKEVQWTRKKEVLSSHFVESSRPSLTTVRLESYHRGFNQAAHPKRPWLELFQKNYLVLAQQEVVPFHQIISEPEVVLL